MKSIKKLLFFLVVFLVPSISLTLKCIGCTHDPSTTGKNLNCTGDIDLNTTVVNIVECTDPDENEACYTQVTCEYDCLKNKRPELMKWNRACCTPRPDHPVCPTNKPNHVVSDGFYEIWRNSCKGDDACNTLAPGGGITGGSGGGNGGSIVVPPKNKSPALFHGMQALVVTLFFAFVHLVFDQ